MSTPASTNNEPRTTNPLVRSLQSRHLILFLAVAYFLVLLPFTPDLASRGNLANILATLLPLFVVATGQTVVLITGGIDLSVCSTMALASVVGGLAMNAESGWLAGSAWATPLGVLLMLATGAVVGIANGVAVAGCRMPPFIVTLTSMMFVSGLAVWVTQSRTIYGLPPSFNALGGQTLVAFAIAAVAGGIVHLLLSRSLWGRWLYATGHNARTALISGVPVGGITIAAYVVSGITAAAAAVLYTGQAETGSPVLGQRLLLDVVAATVIGGTSLFGGRGHLLGTLFGVLFIKLVDNSLNLLNLSLFAITMVKGGIILLAALLDATRERLRTAAA
jgi:ribose/xylose/arabinose/galactoside ABC-type transport system permease subunit